MGVECLRRVGKESFHYPPTDRQTLEKVLAVSEKFRFGLGGSIGRHRSHVSLEYRMEPRYWL